MADRWVVFENSKVRVADIRDGMSNTVFLSETVRSTGNDMTLPAGTTPKFPYQFTLNVQVESLLGCKRHQDCVPLHPHGVLT